MKDLPDLLADRDAWSAADCSGDMYIQDGALEPDAEQALVKRISAMLVEHELRRIVDLVDDPAQVQASATRANSIAWMFVHRTDTYVAGQPVGPQAPRGPVYRFDVKIPEGQLDDLFIPAVNRDILAALVEAEAGRWKHPELRLWVFVQEIKDGTWGAAGMPMQLKGIIDFVSPGSGQLAVDRWQKTQRAADLVGADTAPADA